MGILIFSEETIHETPMDNKFYSEKKVDMKLMILL